MSTWKLVYNKFDPEKENLREALCTLGNGYFGTRGAVPETTPTKVHYPGTYIAGVYNTLPTEVAGRPIYNEDFVNCPNWLMFNYKIDDGPWFNRHNVKILSWKAELHMRKGILSRRLRWQDDKGRITLVESHRLVSMAQPHCGGLRYTFTPENYSGTITVRSGIDGLIINAGVDRYKQLNSRHLEPCSQGEIDKDGIFLQMKTSQSNIQITESMRTLVYHKDEPIHPKLNIMSHGRQRMFHEFTIDVKQGERYSVEKIVAIYTSRDHGVVDDCAISQDTVKQVENFASLFQPHQAKWRALWKRFDVEVKGDDFVQTVLRLHTFHLLQSASTYNEDIDAGMPVRGLHGEAYRGHIFWDELYVFPFYNFHAPEITRALLMYRYRRLGAAKDLAKHHGYRGAMFPWQSASTGEETSQIVHLNPMSGTWGPDYSSIQRHVSIAVAYNVWTYFYMTDDRDFMDRYGAEMLVEISHFWSSIAEFNDQTGRYDIEGVMGPDEFHEKYPGANKGGLKNNAYTNLMAVWVIEKTLYILDRMMIEEDRTALLLKTGVSEKEIVRWRDIVRRMTIPMDKSGLIHQFEGYMDLDELDWEGYKSKYDNIHRVDRILKAEGLSPDSFKVAKQADVLMIFYVLRPEEVKELFIRLGYPYANDLLRINFDYYYPRTSHGSTLSMVVHAHIEHLLGKNNEALKAFTEALKSDIYDTQGGTTQEGIHAGVMGGTLDLCLKAFAGFQVKDNYISFAPALPDGWEEMKFNVRYKDVWYFLSIRDDEMTMKAEPLHKDLSVGQRKIIISIYDNEYELTPGRAQTFPTSPAFIL